MIFQTKSGKPRAEVIAIGEPPAEDLCAPSTPTPSPVTDSFSTPVRFRPCRPSEDVFQNAIMRELLSQRRQQEIMMKKLDIANQRIVALESLVRKGNNSTDALMDIARKFPTRRRLSEPREGDEPTTDPSGIPEEYAISEPELRSMVRDSRNGGNFAVNLTRKLWPELFGEGNLRFNYNWYGGGQLNKQEMDPVRKEVCRKYVCYFFPEFKVEDSWRERIVSKINECLRRNDKRKRGSVSCTVLPPMEPACPDDVFDFNE